MKEQIEQYLNFKEISPDGVFPPVSCQVQLTISTCANIAKEISELDFWQPIETAPKDGTWIQGWADGLGYLGYISMCAYYEFWTADGMSPVFPDKWQPVPNPPKQ